MAIDTGQFIGDINPAIPADLDDRSEGAGQIRAVKTAIKSTFPNVNGRVEISDEKLNSLNTDAFHSISGEVKWIWHKAKIPAGWFICDGKNGTPNLLGKFIVASDAAGQTGGSNIVDMRSGGTALTVAQIPAHAHMYDRTTAIRNGDDGSGEIVGSAGGAATPTSNAGGGQAHDHQVRFDNRPEYMTLIPIMYDPYNKG